MPSQHVLYFFSLTLLFACLRTPKYMPKRAHTQAPHKQARAPSFVAPLTTLSRRPSTFLRLNASSPLAISIKQRFGVSGVSFNHPVRLRFDWQATRGTARAPAPTVAEHLGARCPTTLSSAPSASSQEQARTLPYLGLVSLSFK